jgi:hypothetical protein
LSTLPSSFRGPGLDSHWTHMTWTQLLRRSCPSTSRSRPRLFVALPCCNAMSDAGVTHAACKRGSGCCPPVFRLLVVSLLPAADGAWGLGGCSSYAPRQAWQWRPSRTIAHTPLRCGTGTAPVVQSHWAVTVWAHIMKPAAECAWSLLPPHMWHDGAKVQMRQYKRPVPRQHPLKLCNQGPSAPCELGSPGSWLATMFVATAHLLPPAGIYCRCKRPVGIAKTLPLPHAPASGFEQSPTCAIPSCLHLWAAEHS